MSAVRSTALSFFATIGLIASLILAGYAFLYWLLPSGDPFDRTRVVAAIPSPSGREAAVVYLHLISNFSAEVLAVKLSRPPFPTVGTSTKPTDNVVKVADSRIVGWWTRPGREDTDTMARQLIEVSWKASNILDVCPTGNTQLVNYDSRFPTGNPQVTLCGKANQ